MEKITSLSNGYIKELSQLKAKKVRDELQKFLVEGYHLVEEAHKHQKLETVLITSESDYIDGVKNILVTSQIIDKLSNTVTPQKIIGVCKGGYTKEIKGSRFVLLDNVADPGNVGTIIRSSLGFKIDQIILSPNSCDCFNDKVIRSTQGAIFKVGLVKCDLEEAISKLKDINVTVIGTSLNGEKLNEFPKLNSYAIVLGNEGSGVSLNIQSICDTNVLIPMEKELESLNVGVAGSIMMYELYKSIDK